MRRSRVVICAVVMLVALVAAPAAAAPEGHAYSAPYEDLRITP